VGFSDFITSTTHKTLRGPRGGIILCEEKYGPTIDKGIFPGIQGGPLMHIIAAKAVAFGEALGQEFRDYQRQVVTNARVLAEELNGHGFDLVSGGTDTHLLLVDLTSRGITGQKAEASLGKAGIAANKNTIPFDKRGPKITSGLRLGTPVLTTRGMKEPEMKIVARLIKNVLKNPDDEKTLQDTRSTIMELCESFPIYRFLS
jgi:glycine hydroxymethyltransferase